MAAQKRVACFYRVSTKGQLDGEDIPMQRNACRKFAQEKGWLIVKEYIEKGVSGYHISANDRDEIQKARKDAEDGLYDVLLCFMFDRLGRKDDETPFVLKWFSTKNVELWSVKEGEQRFKDHSDDLINYIRFWQSSGESKKTSMRVSEKHTQMVLEGIYRGGTPPFGYKAIPSGTFNKKGKELLKLIINEEESEIVKIMFNLVYEKGYGGGRIAKFLNEKAKEDDKFRSRKSGKWSLGVVNHILKNPIYKGYMCYGKNGYEGDKKHRKSFEEWILSEKQNPDLVIIEEEIWDRVFEIRTSRSPQNVKRDDINSLKISKSPLLLVGRIKCGHCGSSMTTTYNTRSYTTKDGKINQYRKPKYRCSGKALNKTDCDGQTIYAQNRIEGIVLKEVQKYLKKLEKVDFTKEIQRYKAKHLSEDEIAHKKIQKQIEMAFEELSTLKGEVSKSILGKSSFKPELLSSLIEEKENQIEKLNEQLNKIEEKNKENHSELNDIKRLESYIPEWDKAFKEASPEKKKMMLSTIIDNVVVYRDRVELNVKLNIQAFCSTVEIGGEGIGVGSASNASGRATTLNTLPKELFEKHLEIFFAA